MINTSGSETKIAAAETATERDLVFNHRIDDENPFTPTGETAPPTAPGSRVAVTPNAKSEIKNALDPRGMPHPATLPHFEAPIIVDSNVLGVLSGKIGLTRSGPVEFGAPGTSLTQQESLFALNYPFEKRTRARFAPFYPSADSAMVNTHFFNRTTFVRQTGFSRTLLPNLFDLRSTSAFVTNSPGNIAAPFTTSRKSAFVDHESPKVPSPKSIDGPNANFDNRGWGEPARAASAYLSVELTVADAAGLVTGSDALPSPANPSLALTSEVLASHLSFGSNGARLSGNGTIVGDVVLDANLGIAPGNSPGLLTVSGNLTWSSGGFFELEIQDPTSEPGTGWDAVQINGTLQFPATIGAPLTLQLRSLTESGASGNISNFLASQPYALRVLTASGGINGYHPSAIQITTTGFTNALDGGSFAVLATGNNLMLTFTPVPEPSTWALMLTGASILAAKLVRRRRRA